MERLKLPEKFREFVRKSHTGLLGIVRTAYGETIEFNIQKGIRQGDPLAPILFAIFMDPLHEGFERQEQDQAPLGYSFEEGTTIASKGFADDTTIVSGSEVNLRRQHEWMVTFCKQNGLRLNADKTILVGRIVEGYAFKEWENTELEIDGVKLRPIHHDRSFSYLGVKINMEGNPSDQWKKSKAHIGFFCRVAKYHQLSASQLITMINDFLVPKLNYGALQRLSEEEEKQADNLIKYAVCGALGIGHLSKRLPMNVVATLLNINLPSHQARMTQVSETFIRLNDLPDTLNGALARRRYLDSDKHTGRIKTYTEQAFKNATLKLETNPNISERMLKGDQGRTRGGKKKNAEREVEEEYRSHLKELESRPKETQLISIKIGNEDVNFYTPKICNTGSINSNRPNGQAEKIPQIEIYTDGSFIQHLNRASWSYCI